MWKVYNTPDGYNIEGECQGVFEDYLEAEKFGATLGCKYLITD